MKRNLLVLLFSFFCFPGYSQITLLDTDYPVSMLGVDSLKKTVVASPFPIMPASPGSISDFTTLIDSTSTFFLYRLSSPFSFADSSLYTFFAHSSPKKTQCGISMSDYLEYESDFVGQKFSLTYLTLGPTDSFYISTQNAVYSSPRKIIAFPATAGSSWNSDYSYDLNFELSVAAFSLDHAPGFQRHYTTETNSVIGWGRVRVNDITGTPSPYFDVLQVQTETRTVDSFFLDGAPMSGVLLSIFNLVQGKKDTTFEYNYYRKGEVTPLVKIEFRDAAYTQPYRGTTHVQRIFTNAVSATEAPAFSLYPNPVTNGMIQVRTPAQVGELYYQLTSVDGRVELAGKAVANNGCAAMPVSNVPAGMYLLKIEAGSYIYNSCVQVN